MAQRRSNERSGFTLIELIFVMIIMGMMTTLAVPRYVRFVSNQRLDATARRVQTDLALARRRARFTSASQSVVFDAATGSYVLTAVPDLSDPQRPYTVSLSESPYGARILTASFNSSNTVTFDGYGTLQDAGTVVVAVGGLSRAINVSEGLVTVGPVAVVP